MSALHAITSLERPGCGSIREYTVSGPHNIPKIERNRLHIGILMAGTYLSEGIFEFSVKAPAVIVYPPGSRAGARFAPSHHHFMWLSIERSWYQQSDYKLSLPRHPTAFYTGSPALRAAQLTTAYFDGSSDSAVTLESILHELVESFSEEKILESRPPPWWDKCLEAIHHDPSARLSYLAANVEIDPSYLCRTFRKHMGCTVSEFSLRLRIATAARALARGTGTISTIAQENGFYDQSHFCRHFRRLTGLNPYSYRQTTFR